MSKANTIFSPGIRTVWLRALAVVAIGAMLVAPLLID